LVAAVEEDVLMVVVEVLVGLDRQLMLQVDLEHLPNLPYQ
jgi:hypothetical protein